MKVIQVIWERTDSLILELGQEICKVSLKYLVVSEKKKELKQKNKTHMQTAMMGHVKETREPAERAPSVQNENNLRYKIKQ